MKTSIAVASLLGLFVVAPVFADETHYLNSRSGYQYSQNTRDNHGYIRPNIDRRGVSWNEYGNGGTRTHQQYHDAYKREHKQYHNERNTRAKDYRHERQQRGYARFNPQRCHLAEYRKFYHQQCNSVRRPAQQHGQHQAFSSWWNDAGRHKH